MHARAPRRTGTQHEADVIVTDDGGRKKAGLRRILKMPFQIIFWTPGWASSMHHKHDFTCTAWGNVKQFWCESRLANVTLHGHNIAGAHPTRLFLNYAMCILYASQCAQWRGRQDITQYGL